MRLVYKFNIGENENISSLCKISNNLYNQALYIFRETLSKEGKWLSYFELDAIMKNTNNLDGDINYRLLKAQCSQQVLRILDKNIKSYYKSVQDYKKHPTKYKEKPGRPNYKKRGYEFNLYYTSQSCKIKDGKIILSKDISIPIPQYEKYSDLIKDFKQIRIKPLSCGYKIEIIYEVKDTEVSKDREEKIASIDLGIDNLATLISEDFTVLFSGKFVKSYNKLFNKTLAKLNSIKDLQKIKGITKRIKKLYYDRERYIEDVRKESGSETYYERECDALFDIDGRGNTERLVARNPKLRNLLEDDEYIPSLGQLNLMAHHMDELNKAFAYVSASPLSSARYWSSTEYSKVSAWFVSFSIGGTHSNIEYNSYRVRAVIDF